MRLTIIIIGDEILLGQVTDTNSGTIARKLGPMGCQVVETLVVGDDAEAIRSAVDHAMGQSDLVITTGGLGPTKDDITKKVLAEYFGGEMVEDPAVLENVRRVFNLRGLPLNELTCSQAIVPSSCRVIQNELGTAPIMWFETTGDPRKVLISMPGVPFETVGMLNRRVVREIQAAFTPDIETLHHTYMVTGIAESALAQQLTGYETTLPANMHLAYLPSPGYIRLRLDATYRVDDSDHTAYEMACEQLKQLIANYIINDGEATIAEIVLQRLRERGLTLGTAESCTGGNIAHQITLVPGSSDTFLGSVVSYANRVKHNVLGVSDEDLTQHGAVSEPVVIQMAEGACRTLGTDCAVATSGIAGPGGAVPGKPVGTIWMSVHTPNGTVTALRHLPGDRTRVIDRATTDALLLLLKSL